MTTISKEDDTLRRSILDELDRTRGLLADAVRMLQMAEQDVIRLFGNEGLNDPRVRQ